MRVKSALEKAAPEEQRWQDLPEAEFFLGRERCSRVAGAWDEGIIKQIEYPP